MEGISPNSCTRQQQVQEKKTRPQEQLNCPRCNSTNTKFCYYNNYSLTQPRYFCKTCRRYWTEGGSLRNVPVGGGSRKNKKIINSSSSAPASTPLPVPPTIASSKVIPDLNPPTIPHHHQNPNKMMQGGGQDLNLAFPSMDQKYHHHQQGLSPYLEMMPNNGDNSTHHHPNSLSALDLLRSSMVSRGLGPYAPNSLMQNSSSPIYPSGFPMQEVKPSNGLGFSMDHHHGMGNRSSYDHHEVQESNNNGGGRVLFPFGEVKQHSSQGDEVGHNDNNNNKEQGNSSTGYWSGMIGEGSW